MMFTPLPEDSSAYIAYLGFAVFVVTALVRGFALKRPKNHYKRVQQRAARRALRA